MVLVHPELPKVADDLGGGYVVGVVGNETKDECPVLPEVTPCELVDHRHVTPL